MILFLVIFFLESLGVKLLIETTEEVSVDQAFEREASITREFNSFFFFSLVEETKGANDH